MSILLDQQLDPYVPFPEPRVSALLCWPVEWIERHRILDPIPGLHCTMLYFPDVVEAGISKDAILKTLRSIEDREPLGYSLTKVKWVSAFGPEKNVPVLELDLDHHWEHHNSLEALKVARLEPD